MDVHSPKPWHGVREFLKEYLIVVIGVLTALAGEQAVEWLHWRHEVHETEQALHQEIGRNLAAWDYRMEQSDCVHRRLDDLKRWRASWRGGAGGQLTGFISAPVSFSVYTDAWEVAETGQVAAHIPLERRMQYAKLYAALRALRAKSDLATANWRSLQDFEDAPSLDTHDLMRLQGVVNYLNYFEVSVASANMPLIRKRAAELHIGKGPLEGNSAALEEGREMFCKSIFPAAPTA